MNYRHIYHAGNFADVLKHAIVAAIITYLQKKDGAFRVIDTHAGLGVYDLGSDEAQKTGEWQTGIGRIAEADLSDDLKAFLAPWLAAVAEVNGGSLVPLKRYPGSPNTLDALCRRFGIDNSGREKHGALLDAELLADVYLELIGGRQPALVLQRNEQPPAAQLRRRMLTLKSTADLQTQPPRAFAKPLPLSPPVKKSTASLPRLKKRTTPN